MEDLLFSLLLLKNGETISVGRTEKSFKEANILEEVFNIASYPDCETKRNLSILLKMSHKTIQIWFQNRRRYIKNGMKKRTVLKIKNYLNEGKQTYFISQNDNYKINGDGQVVVQVSVKGETLLMIYSKHFGIDLKGFYRK